MAKRTRKAERQEPAAAKAPAKRQPAKKIAVEPEAKPKRKRKPRCCVRIPKSYMLYVEESPDGRIGYLSRKITRLLSGDTTAEWRILKGNEVTDAVRFASSESVEKAKREIAAAGWKARVVTEQSIRVGVETESQRRKREAAEAAGADVKKAVPRTVRVRRCAGRRRGKRKIQPDMRPRK